MSIHPTTAPADLVLHDRVFQLTEVLATSHGSRPGPTCSLCKSRTCKMTARLARAAAMSGFSLAARRSIVTASEVSGAIAWDHDEALAMARASCAHARPACRPSVFKHRPAMHAHQALDNTARGLGCIAPELTAASANSGLSSRAFLRWTKSTVVEGARDRYCLTGTVPMPRKCAVLHDLRARCG